MWRRVSNLPVRPVKNRSHGKCPGLQRRDIMLKRVKIHEFEIGLLFRDGEFRGLLEAGRHWFIDPLGRVRVDVASLRAPWLVHDKLDVIVKSGALGERARLVDLKDYERALVWVDGRFSHVLPPGLFAYWITYRDVKVEVVDARAGRFVHQDLPVILKTQGSERVLEAFSVPAGHVGVWFRDGNFIETLPPGRHAFWQHMTENRLVPV